MCKALWYCAMPDLVCFFINDCICMASLLAAGYTCGTSFLFFGGLEKIVLCTPSLRLVIIVLCTEQHNHQCERIPLFDWWLCEWWKGKSNRQALPQATTTASQFMCRWQVQQ